MFTDLSQELTNILRFWTEQMLDPQGGFYGQMRGDGTLVPQAPRGAILNARILWTFSASYRVTGQAQYLATATHALRYILQHFVDREQGGTYWEVDAQGRPTNMRKQFYAQAFMLYGLTEYVRATVDHPQCEALRTEALALAWQLFDLIERYSREPRYGGYIEACTRDWGEMDDMRLSVLDLNYPKSQNTHLHILEAFTNLLRTPGAEDRRAEVAQAQRHLIGIFLDHILNAQTMHLDLFFDMDWQRGGAHSESYGHDIEFSWLLHEAALVLGDQQVLERVEPIVRAVAQAATQGLNADGSMTHEANLDTGYREPDRHWWVQAETVVGYHNIYRHFGDEASLERSQRCWQYIRQHLIDRDRGEWYWSCDEAGNPNLADDHAGFWKCPYHNARMCLELLTW